MDKKGRKEEKLSRRKAIKRIAAAFAGAVAGSQILVRTPKAWGRYISIEGSYVDTVYVDTSYVNRGPSYNDYVSFYTSYSSHSPPPPPYISK